MRYHSRVYIPADCCVFRKTREGFGGLSNMASGYPLVINETQIRTSEALYQACRYPHLPELQTLIIDQGSGMSAKMKSKVRYGDTRRDWDEVRVHVMRWVLEVKLAQNFSKFGQLLESTHGRKIVEDSHRDQFWGAVLQKDGTLRGVNALGRLLMQLRDTYCSAQRYTLLYVPPPEIPEFYLFRKAAAPVDRRLEFMSQLFRDWTRDSISVQSPEKLQMIADILKPPRQSGTPAADDSEGAEERTWDSPSLFE